MKTPEPSHDLSASIEAYARGELWAGDLARFWRAEAASWQGLPPRYKPQ